MGRSIADCRCALKPERKTLRELVEAGKEWLADKGLDQPRLDAELLIAHAFGLTRLELYLDLDRPVNDQERAAARELLVRRARREPVAYLTGEREFYGHKIEVTPAVLIPRPDTETLVDAALARVGEADDALIVDVATGSGCVAVAIALARPRARLIATDLSAAALEVAARNLARHDLAERVELREGDLLSPVTEVPDLVVGNPPYIARGTELMADVADYEPALALYGEGPDALGHHARVLAQAAALGAPPVLLEIGFDQAEAARALSAPGYALADIALDLGGRPRVAVWTPAP